MGKIVFSEDLGYGRLTPNNWERGEGEKKIRRN